MHAAFAFFFLPSCSSILFSYEFHVCFSFRKALPTSTTTRSFFMPNYTIVVSPTTTIVTSITGHGIPLYIVFASLFHSYSTQRDRSNSAYRRTFEGSVFFKDPRSLFLSLSSLSLFVIFIATSSSSSKRLRFNTPRVTLVFFFLFFLSLYI